MCLKACRRLPLNAPCVSLRLNSLTPEAVKMEAAKALLSGGAHPILFHDDKMVDGTLLLFHKLAATELSCTFFIIKTIQGYTRCCASLTCVLASKSLMT